MEAYGIVVIVVPALTVLGIIALPEIMKHRLEMAKVRRGADSGVDNSAELDALRKRCEALEKRCEKLEEQVVDAHAQLADERRQLDSRLASILPDTLPAENRTANPAAARVKTML